MYFIYRIFRKASGNSNVILNYSLKQCYKIKIICFSSLYSIRETIWCARPRLCDVLGAVTSPQGQIQNGMSSEHRVSITQNHLQ